MERKEPNLDDQNLDEPDNPNLGDPRQQPLDPMGKPVPNSSDVDEGELDNFGMEADDYDQV